MSSNFDSSDISEESSDDFEIITQLIKTKTQIISLLKPFSILLKEKILYDVATVVNVIWEDFSTIRSVISNLFNALQIASLKEYQSGWFRSVLKAVCGNNVSNRKVADLLGVHRHSVDIAKKQVNIISNNGIYHQFVQKSIIKRVRIHPQITKQILEWMKTAFVPSSNSNNVVQKKRTKLFSGK